MHRFCFSGIVSTWFSVSNYVSCDITSKVQYHAMLLNIFKCFTFCVFFVLVYEIKSAPTYCTCQANVVSTKTYTVLVFFFLQPCDNKKEGKKSDQ